MLMYESTRGQAPRVHAKEAILKGIAGDGGLYVPERVPKVGLGFIEGLAAMDYAHVAAAVIAPFLDDFTDDEIWACVSGAYGAGRFDDPDVAPLHALYGDVYTLELFHGPTCAFKDMALQFLPRALTAARQSAKGGARGADGGAGGADGGADVAILVATSGDTGKAALEGFRDVPGTCVVVFYPKDGVSEVQRLQMATQEGANVEVVAVLGNFDDTQAGVKGIFADADVAAALRAWPRPVALSSANSINWGRLVPQIAYYFWAYAQLVARGAAVCGEPVRFAVPTGNFGNILAGWYAREMGLPVSELICASNSNDVLADFIRTGIYDRNRDFFVTISPSMDILVSSNLERLLYEACGKDAALVRTWMGELRASGRFDVGPGVRAKISSVFIGASATEDETRAAMRRSFEAFGYVMDPHTAVGLHAIENAGPMRAAQGKTVLVSTASPFKFAKDVYGAIAAASPGASPELDAFACVEALELLCGAPAPEPLRRLREKPVLHSAVAARDEMKEAALSALGRLYMGPSAPVRPPTPVGAPVHAPTPGHPVCPP